MSTGRTAGLTVSFGKPPPFLQPRSRFYETASKMRGVGRVAITLSIVVAIATLWAAYRFRASLLYEDEEIIFLSVCGGVGSFSLLVLGIYLVNKQYWNDKKYRNGIRASLFQTLINSNYSAYEERLESLIDRPPDLVREEELKMIAFDYFIEHTAQEYIQRYGTSGLIDGMQIWEKLSEELAACKKICDFFEKAFDIAKSPTCGALNPMERVNYLELERLYRLHSSAKSKKDNAITKAHLDCEHTKAERARNQAIQQARSAYRIEATKINRAWIDHVKQNPLLPPHQEEQT